MLSSRVPNTDSDLSDEILQDAQLPDEQQAHISPRSEQPSDELAVEGDTTLTKILSPAGSSVNSARLTNEERIKKLVAHAKENNATLEYDRDGQLQPVYPNLPSGLFDDNPSSALWRHRTTAQRDIFASLDQARSSNLSIHLYNIFRLRQRARSQVPDGGGFVETKDPPRAWAAWPMTPDIVPRDHQQKLWEDDDWREGPYVKRERRPGDELRDLLIARAVKTGKERFLARESENSSVEGEEDKGTKPVVLADDEAAEKMLRPSIQHVLGSLDHLLEALHHARSSYIAPVKPKRKKKSSASKNLLPKGMMKPRNHGLLRTNGSDDSNEFSNSETEAIDLRDSNRQVTQKGKVPNASAKPSATFLRHKAKVAGLRDWTDIIGVASMTGVNSDVTRKITSHCTDIFATDAKLRTIDGGLTNDKETFYLPNEQSSEQTDGLGNRDREMHGGVHVDGFLQKIKGNPYWKSISRKHKQRMTLGMETKHASENESDESGDETDNDPNAELENEFEDENQTEEEDDELEDENDVKDESKLSHRTP